MISIVVITKDEPALEYTVDALVKLSSPREDVEVVVVDAGDRTRRALRDGDVTWIDYERPPGVRVSIPQQRNVGLAAARGEVVVFMDAGCEPRTDWLDSLTEQILAGEERVVTGLARSWGNRPIADSEPASGSAVYVEECATINLAIARSVFDEVGGFDESFEYGSDIDFSWRVRDHGIPIRANRDAVVFRDWGSRRRQVVRTYRYGKARAQLYRKHHSRLPRALRDDPVAVAYPLFLVGLPLTLWRRSYLALLLIPLVKNRNAQPVRAITGNLVYGLGVLRGLTR